MEKGGFKFSHHSPGASVCWYCREAGEKFPRYEIPAPARSSWSEWDPPRPNDLAEVCPACTPRAEAGEWGKD